MSSGFVTSGSTFFIQFFRGFSFVTKGPDVGHYRHDYFHRDKPFLVSQMYYHNSRAKKALKEPPRPTSSNEVAAIGALDKYERTTASRAMMQGSIEDRQRMMMSDNQNCLPFARASSSSSSRISNQPLKKRESGAQDQIDGDDHVMHELRMALHQQHKAMDGRHRTSDFLDAKNTESFSDCDDRYTQEVAMPSQEGHLWSTPDARESAEFALGPFLHELMQLRTHLLERSRINIPRHQGRNHHFPVFGTCNVDAPLATFANYRHNHDLVMAPLLRNQQGLDPRRQELLLRLQDPSLQAMLLRQEISMLPNSSRLTPSSLGTVTGGHVSVLQRSLEMQGAYSDILERMRSGEGSSLYPDPRLHPPSSSLPLIARAQLPDNSPSNDIQGIPQRQLRPNDDNTRSSP